jgi:hypothetical protein
MPNPAVEFGVIYVFLVVKILVAIIDCIEPSF